MADVEKTFRPIHEVDLCSLPSEDPGQSYMDTNNYMNVF